VNAAPVLPKQGQDALLAHVGIALGRLCRALPGLHSTPLRPQARNRRGALSMRGEALCPA